MELAAAGAFGGAGPRLGRGGAAAGDDTCWEGALGLLGIARRAWCLAQCNGVFSSTQPHQAVVPPGPLLTVLRRSNPAAAGAPSCWSAQRTARGGCGRHGRPGSPGICCPARGTVAVPAGCQAAQAVERAWRPAAAGGGVRCSSGGWPAPCGLAARHLRCDKGGCDRGAMIRHGTAAMHCTCTCTCVSEQA